MAEFFAVGVPTINEHLKNTYETGELPHEATIRKFRKTILHEFYQVAFRRKLYFSLEKLQAKLDIWLEHDNTERIHQGKTCCGRTAMQTLLEGENVWNEKAAQLN